MRGIDGGAWFRCFRSSTGTGHASVDVSHVLVSFPTHVVDCDVHATTSMDGQDRSQLVQQFCNVTGEDPRRAEFYLESSRWDLETAVHAFYEQNHVEERHETVQMDETKPEASLEDEESRGGASGSRSKPSNTRNVRGLADLGGQGSSDDDEQMEWFTGGEKSGMMVQDPNKKKGEIVEDLFKKAKEHGAKQGRPEDLNPTTERQYQPFAGQGRTLSGDVRPGPSLQANAHADPLAHTITFWSNGFTVDDGPLRSFDDEANVPFLRSIARGECPKELEPADRSVPVTVNMVRKDHEEWKPQPTPKYVPFAGSGRTLGSAASPPSPTPAESTEQVPVDGTGVDDSRPTTSIQVRLADGTRMVAQFNLDQTVMDIRHFIDMARPGSTGSYTLMNANDFPPKPLTDPSATIESANLLNAVVNQRM